MPVPQVSCALGPAPGKVLPWLLELQEFKYVTSKCVLFILGRGGKQAVNDHTVGVPAPRKSQEQDSVPFF